MARQINRLSARQVATIVKPGRYADGGNLYVEVDVRSSKRWSFIYRDRRTGKLREMGLGGFPAVSLAAARDSATRARSVLANGRDPIEERRKERSLVGRGVTFGEVAADLVKHKGGEWESDRYRKQWTARLNAHASPLLSMRCEQITVADILGVLKPLWGRHGHTGMRLRRQIEAVLDSARAHGFAQEGAANPARWKGHLDKILARPSRLTRGHHKAMPREELPAFMKRLHMRAAMSALALEFTILTVARTNECLGAKWPEVDEANRVWTVPRERMLKTKRPHRVALSIRALDALRIAGHARVSDYVFPGQRPSRPLSNMAMEMLMKRMSVTNGTPHGFRSTFRDWAEDCTEFPRELAEAALSHSVGDETERAYRRGDALEKRRALMEQWAAFVTSPVGE